MRRFGVLLSLPVLMAFAPPQEGPSAKYMGEKGWIYIRNYSVLKSTNKGEIIITGEGKPMLLQDTGNGMTITGNNIRVVLKPGPEGRTILDQATVSESAKAVFDSELHYRTAVEMATQYRPAPPKPTETSVATVESETMVYTREGEEGVLTFPVAAKMVMDTKGQQVSATAPSSYTQNLEIRGSKGRFTASVAPNGQFTMPRTGRLEGPVTMHLVRNETIAAGANAQGPKVERTDINGTTDLVEIDMTTSQPTMTFTGNVYVQGTAKGMPGEVRGEKGTIVFDRMFDVTSYEFTGSPTTTRVKVGNPTTGGGR